VTPWLVDHSGYDSYAMVVDGGAKRLMYTGDLRGHGRKGRLFERMLTDPPQGVDTLLMEGTHVRADGPSPHDGPVASESDVELAMAETFRGVPGLPVVVSSAQNIDRLVTVYRAARRAGRTLLIDLYTATVAAATGRATIPQVGFPALGVYIPQRQRVRVKTSREFHRTHAIRAHRVFPEALAAAPDRYVLLSGSSTVPELLRDPAVNVGVVVWSLWSGYLAQASGVRLRAQVAAARVPLVEHHTSGHAPLPDLKRLVAAIRPQQVVPIHTEGAHEFASHFPDVAPREDGTWWTV